MAAGSHVCSPMRVENLRRQRLGHDAAPDLYYPVKKRPNQGRFEAVTYARDLVGSIMMGSALGRRQLWL